MHWLREDPGGWDGRLPEAGGAGLARGDQLPFERRGSTRDAPRNHRGGGQAELLPFDVADPEAIEQALGRWSEAHPDDYIAVVVNNAGIRRDNLMVFMQNDEWHPGCSTRRSTAFSTSRGAS